MSAVASSAVRRVLDALEARGCKPRPSGAGWSARCPAHEDRTPSLSVREGDDGKALIKCHTACPAEAIAGALGLQLTDLFPDREPAARPRTTRYEIRDPVGALVAVHVREDRPDGAKRFWWEQPDGTRGLGGRKVADLPLSGVEQLVTAPVDVPVVLCEGEKAAEALRSRGILAVGTVTGASGTPSDQNLRPLLGRPVVLWRDNDSPGRAHMDRIAAALARLGHRDVRWLTWREAPPKGDAFDFFAAGGTALQAEGLIAGATPAGAAAAAGDEAEDAGPLLVRARDLPAKPVTLLVDGLLFLAMLTILSGRDKRGKTLLAQEILRAVLLDRRLLGRFAVRHGPVVAAFLDDPWSVTKQRLDTLGVLGHPDLYVVDPERYLGEPFAFLDQLEAEVAAVKPVLIVIDALYLLAPTSRDAGNDASRMTPIMRRLDRLATASGATVLLVAHDNKSGADVAGSFVVRAMAKVILRIKLPRGFETDDPDEEPTTTRRLLLVESKLAPPAKYMLECGGPGRWSFLGEPKAVRESDIEAAILDSLQATSRGTAKQIAEAIGRRYPDVLAALERLVAAGRVAADEVKTGGRGRPATFYRDPTAAPTFVPEVPEARERKSPREQKSSAQVLDFSSKAPREHFRSAPDSLGGADAEQKSASPSANGAAAPEADPGADRGAGLLAELEARGWPRLPRRPGVTAGGSEPAWRTWMSRAVLADLDWLERKLAEAPR